MQVLGIKVEKFCDRFHHLELQTSVFSIDVTTHVHEVEGYTETLYVQVIVYPI